MHGVRQPYRLFLARASLETRGLANGAVDRLVLMCFCFYLMLIGLMISFIGDAVLRLNLSGRLIRGGERKCDHFQLRRQAEALMTVCVHKV